jgi:uncharacterized RDD family membrane protein YckC
MKGKIACFIHANRDATTTCASCANRLCSACAVNAGGIDYCDACAPENAVRHISDEDYERIPVVDPQKAGRAQVARRAFGLVVDFGLFFGIVGVITLASFGLAGSAGFVLSPSSGPGFWGFWMLVLLAAIVYSAVLTSMTGQTLGKQVAGVIILEPDGHILPLRAALIRSLMAAVSALPFGLGFLWAIWDKDGRTWHDRVANTAAFPFEDVM